MFGSAPPFADNCAIRQSGRLGAERFRLGDRLAVVAVGDVEHLRVPAAGRTVQIGDVVGECVEQLGDDHVIIVAPVPCPHRAHNLPTVTAISREVL